MQISEPAEYVLLGLLYSQPMHGYEMFQQLEHGILGQIVHLEMSQMYAFLKKLERLHYIEAELEPQGIRPPRRIFHLTDEGRDVFLSWLIRPVDKPRDIRILFLIQLYFVQRFLPEQTSSLVERQIEACRRFLAHLEAQSSGNGHKITVDDAAFFNHVVLRSRTYQTRALLEWLHELRSGVGITST
ncbi:MAG: helix-turn-helix transcriptional regulator [Ktedonobacteraceae bacterium]|nr:helix-turn-helix transcriptional regulator [Ktedonobacteraceae bacterium]